MTQAIAIRPETTMDEWSIIREQSAVLVKTGFLPQSIKTPEQAMAIILTGRELGIGTMAALQSINIIANKPTISPQLMLALINRTKEIEDISIKDDGKCCSVTMKRRGRQPHSESFSMADAAAMKTTEWVNGEKKTIALSEKYNWKQQPATMRKWRAIAACARVVFPDVILGLYTPDEMGAVVNEEGEVIDAPAPVVSIVQDQPIIDATPEHPATLDRTPDLITESQMEDLAFVLDTLSGYGVSDEQLLAGVNNLAGTTFPALENDLLATLTNAQAAKVISAFNRKLDERQAAKEAK
jgi:hypothetical protein